jgi:hypothetical protein
MRAGHAFEIEIQRELVLMLLVSFSGGFIRLPLLLPERGL